MIPILYEANETSFSTNGIGRLSDVISCVVTEERNGIYILEMEYPITGVFYGDIAVDKIVLAKPFDGGTDQPFRICRISRPLNGVVTIDAEHISYILNKTVAMPFKADTCQEALDNLKTYAATDCPFTFTTDKSVIAKMELKEPRAIRGLLGGEQGSVLDNYGKGDYEFDRFRVILHVNRGQDNGVTLRYGKNITELENVVDMENTYTGIVPFWASEDETVTLPEKTVLSSHTGRFANKLIKAVDLSSEWEDAPTVEQLRERAQKYVLDNEGWNLAQNIKVSFVNLLDTEEYKDIVALERVRMCDTITILVTPLGVNVKAQVIRTVYDVLKERYNEIEIGETRPTLGTVIQEQVTEPIVKETSTRMQKAIKYATDLITGVKGGYLIINTDDNGTPTELLIMNNPDKNLATQVLRINMNGIGFGKSYKGPFTTAWTLDGHFVANYIDTGTLNADLIRTGILRALNNSRNYWNMHTGEFHLRSDGATNGIDYVNGVLAINAANITVGTLSANIIRGGVLQSNNGRVYFDLNNSRLVCVSADGRIVSTFSDGTLHARASGYPDIQIQVYSSILNQLTLNGAFYAKSTALFSSTVHADGNISTSHGVQAAGNINAGMDVSAGGQMFANAFNQRSDRNRKKNIAKLAVKKAKDFIMKLIPSSFQYKTSAEYHHGFIAQDVKAAMNGDEWGVYVEFDDQGERTCGIGYTEIIADLVKVVQDQERRITELEGKLA